MLVPVAERPPAVDLEAMSPGRPDAEPSQREPQTQARRLRRRLFQCPDQGQQLCRATHQVSQGCRFRLVCDIVEQSRIARANRLDVDPKWRQSHRRRSEPVRVTDRAVETRLRAKVWPAVGPVGDRWVGRERGSTMSEVRVRPTKGEPSTEAVGQPIVPHAPHHLFSDAANGHALG